MPLSTFDLDWLNHNSQRAYPLAEDATRTDMTGSLKLPDDVILAMYLPIHAGLDVLPEKFFLRTVTVFSAGVLLAIAYDDGTASPPIAATAVIPLTTHIENRSYTLAGVDDFSDTVGKVVIGAPAALTSLPPGQYQFSASAGKLDTDVVRPMLRGVSSLILVNGTERSAPLTGDVELTAGTNTRLTVQTVAGVHRVRIDAISGEGLNDDCVCEGITTTPPIKTINGIKPTAAGDFIFLGSDCLEIGGITNGLKLTDTCSDPCCGCTELEAITRDLDRFGEAAATLTNHIARLESQVTTMSMTVLGARLSDSICGG